MVGVLVTVDPLPTQQKSVAPVLSPARGVRFEVEASKRRVRQEATPPKPSTSERRRSTAAGAAIAAALKARSDAVDETDTEQRWDVPLACGLTADERNAVLEAMDHVLTSRRSARVFESAADTWASAVTATAAGDAREDGICTAADLRRVLLRCDIEAPAYVLMPYLARLANDSHQHLAPAVALSAGRLAKQGGSSTRGLSAMEVLQCAERAKAAWQSDACPSPTRPVATIPDGDDELQDDQQQPTPPTAAELVAALVFLRFALAAWHEASGDAFASSTEGCDMPQDDARQEPTAADVLLDFRDRAADDPGVESAVAQLSDLPVPFSIVREGLGSVGSADGDVLKLVSWKSMRDVAAAFRDAGVGHLAVAAEAAVPDVPLGAQETLGDALDVSSPHPPSPSQRRVECTSLGYLARVMAQSSAIGEPVDADDDDTVHALPLFAAVPLVSAGDTAASFAASSSRGAYDDAEDAGDSTDGEARSVAASGRSRRGSSVGSVGAPLQRTTSMTSSSVKTRRVQTRSQLLAHKVAAAGVFGRKTQLPTFGAASPPPTRARSSSLVPGEAMKPMRIEDVPVHDMPYHLYSVKPALRARPADAPNFLRCPTATSELLRSFTTPYRATPSPQRAARNRASEERQRLSGQQRRQQYSAHGGTIADRSAASSAARSRPATTGIAVPQPRHRVSATRAARPGAHPNADVVWCRSTQPSLPFATAAQPNAPVGAMVRPFGAVSAQQLAAVVDRSKRDVAKMWALSA